jgi:rubredoxin
VADTPCPRCGRPVRPGARFCGSCGFVLAPSQGQPVQGQPPQAPTQRVGDAAGLTCPHCGSPLRPAARFCPTCGKGPTPAAPPSAPTWNIGEAPLPSPPPWQPAGGTLPPLPPPIALPAAPAESGYSRAYLMRHAITSAALTFSLMIALASVYVWDSGRPLATPTPPTIPTAVPPTATPGLSHPDPVIEIGYQNDGRFGVSTTIGDPERAGDENKRLTFAPNGDTSNIRIWVDGNTPMYGDGGRFVERPNGSGDQVIAVWSYGNVQIRQETTIVASSTLLDTVRIAYTLENQDSVAHDVGLRLMIDTLIGDNDGVPFVVPGRDGITNRAIELTGAAIPDFIQALEQQSLVDPGVIVNLTLKGGAATPPDRVVISGWYYEDADWEYLSEVGGVGAPLERSGGAPDSAVGLYYNPARLEPGQTRTIVTFYGLGAISSTASGNAALSLTFSREVNEGDSFWIVAVVSNPTAGQSLNLQLPAGLALTAGETADKAITFTAGDAYTQVSWLVEATEAVGETSIQVTLSPDGIDESQLVTILGAGVTR